ncbi:MAG: CPBP family intramembrane metalloprotease [Verrucomicrobia bacterium]|nr:CPBP family intramembrane metalloprotease [Verrucomicrobiota bacterium]
MSETANLEIIRDLFGIAGVALIIGLGVYAFIRAGGGPQWNCDGNVLARPYGWPDGIVALLLLAFFIYCSTAGTAQPETTASAGVPGSESNATAQLASMLFMLVVALMILVYMRIRGQEPGEMFGIRQLPPLRALLFGAASLVLIYGVMTGVYYLVKELVFDGKWPDDSAQESIKDFQASASILYKIMLGLGAVVIAPVAEETIFRGFFYGVTKRFSDRWFAAVFTSVIFACVHCHFGSALPLFTLAMGFAIAYEITGCLLVPVAMHSLFNAFNLLLLIFGPKS